MATTIRSAKARPLPVPTGEYMTETLSSEAENMFFLVNNQLARIPTNPHVYGMMLVSHHGRDFSCTIPEWIFDNTNVKAYFRALIEIQASESFVSRSNPFMGELNAFAEKAYKLVEDAQISNEQRTAIFRLLSDLTQRGGVSPASLSVKFSADDEFLVEKQSDEGNHYLVVGESTNEISYVFVSKTPGEYATLHVSEIATITDLVDTFVKA